MPPDTILASSSSGVRWASPGDFRRRLLPSMRLLPESLPGSGGLNLGHIEIDERESLLDQRAELRDSRCQISPQNSLQTR